MALSLQVTAIDNVESYSDVWDSSRSPLQQLPRPECAGASLKWNSNEKCLYCPLLAQYRLCPCAELDIHIT